MGGVLVFVAIAVAVACQLPRTAEQDVPQRHSQADTHKAETIRARQANDARKVAYDFGGLLGIGLREDATIEVVLVPASLRAGMASALRLLKAGDAIVRQALRDRDVGNGTIAITQLEKVTALVGRPTHYLNAAGLRDCGLQPDLAAASSS